MTIKLALNAPGGEFIAYDDEVIGGTQVVVTAAEVDAKLEAEARTRFSDQVERDAQAARDRGDRTYQAPEFGMFTPTTQQQVRERVAAELAGERLGVPAKKGKAKE